MMSYTHEEIINALTVIKEVCKEYSLDCDRCPFFVGCCRTVGLQPNKWMINEEPWRAFHEL